MVRKFIENICDDWRKIENADAALVDTERLWVVHHRKETGEGLTSMELRKRGLYLHRPPEELIFLTEEDHMALHTAVRRERKAQNAPERARTSPESFRADEACEVKPYGEENPGKCSGASRKSDVAKKKACARLIESGFSQMEVIAIMNAIEDLF